MDRVIENKRWIKKKYIPYLVGGALALILVIWLIFGNHLSTLKVDKRLLTIEPAQQGQFNDYVRVNGQVQPVTTIQLSPLESGMVEEKLVEEGAMVHKGQVIVRLSNSSLSIAILQSEADLAEKDNFLRNTMVSMEQQKLDLQKERLSLNIDVQRKERKYRQNERLYKEKLIAREDYLQAKEDYELALETRHVVQERQKQDSIYRTTQIESLEENLQSMRQNMMLIRQRMDNLNVKSPIDGQLGTLDAELGQSVSNTVKIGQINDLSDYKIEALIDEHYIDRVRSGLPASFERQDARYDLVVSKVYPDVKEGQFKTDFTFTSKRPDNIRTGQTYYINLELGQPSDAILIPRGAFYQKTGGNWIYVVTEDGSRAYRRTIRIGRQNPQYYEVVEGLQAGEKVIVSGYDTFGDNEMLVLT